MARRFSSRRKIFLFLVALAAYGLSFWMPSADMRSDVRSDYAARQGEPEYRERHGPEGPEHVRQKKARAGQNSPESQPQGRAFRQTREQVSVRRVSDGDTIVLHDGRTVRLLGIDSPELARQGTPAGFYATEAHTALRHLIEDRPLRIETENIDRYGRVLAVLYAEDGTNINEQLVRMGAAMVYPSNDLPPALLRRFQALQRSAVKARVGMWRALDRAGAFSGPYVGNVRSYRFFSPSCDGVQSIAVTNRVEFADAESAFAEGYSPVRHCDIWPENEI